MKSYVSNDVQFNYEIDFQDEELMKEEKKIFIPNNEASYIIGWREEENKVLEIH